MKPEEIKTNVCKFYGISEKDAESSCRKREFVQARHVGMYFMKKYTNLSVSAIARMYGGRDHSTTLHAIQKVNDHIDVDKFYRTQIKNLDLKLKSIQMFTKQHCAELIGFENLKHLPL
jgi:chromosomal replication initiator protein